MEVDGFPKMSFTQFGSKNRGKTCCVIMGWSARSEQDTEELSANFMTLATHRTPISILQEVCVKRGITPIYELISSEGPIHEPSYVYLCTAGAFSATSKGSSKKKAKHQASYLVLLKMLASSSIPEYDKTALRELHHTAANLFGSEFLDSIEESEAILSNYRKQREDEVNYVGQLQELCQKNMWPPPTYEFITLGQSLREYHCRVKLWKWECQGSGASKKAAKRIAAGALLHRILVQNLIIPPEALESMEEENLSLLDKHDNVDVHDVKIGSEIDARLTARCLRWLRDENGNKIRVSSQYTSSATTDYCAQLEELAKNVRVPVVYTYERNTKSGLIYSLLQLTTTPPHVIKGSGQTDMEAARQSAAARAILFIQSMSSDQPQMNHTRWLDPLSQTIVTT